MTNLTSAGQLAGVPVIAAGGGYAELALTQLVINMRYALMSVSLSQKLGDSVTAADRFIISFANTDEIFAVAASRFGTVGRKYLYGLIIPPYIGWSAGTLIGAAAGNILPEIVTSSLGIAIYGMFIAVVIPPAKKDRATACCILIIKYLVVMAGVTYLIRMLPLVLIKKKLKNRFFKSFLYYIPYAVLSVMTIPAIFSSTGSALSAAVGFVTAVILAYFERGLLTVAAFSCAAVFIAELILRLAL